MTSHIIHALGMRNLRHLLDRVCRRRVVTPEQLCSRGRTQAVVRARQELWWQLRHDPEHHYSLSEIARLFGRDHSTVLYGIHAHRRRLHTLPNQLQQP